MPVPQTTEQTVLDYLECEAAFAEKAAAAEQARIEQHNKVASLLPATIDTLVTTGCIKAADGENAAALLSNHALALGFVQRLARYAEKQAAIAAQQLAANGQRYTPIGQPVNGKVAGTLNGRKLRIGESATAYDEFDASVRRLAGN